VLMSPQDYPPVPTRLVKIRTTLARPLAFRSAQGWGVMAMMVIVPFPGP
jgi:hypothetical protein